MAKKIVAMISALALVLALSACGASTSAPVGDTTAAADAPGQTTAAAQTTAAEPESDPYEITYTNAKVWTNSIVTTWVQAIVEITNTGSKNLYLGSASYDLEAADGSLVASESLVSTFPDVIAPGEKGYMYSETTLDNYSGDGTLTVVPHLDISEATVGLIRYDTSEIAVSDGEYMGLKVLGRVENTTSEAGQMVYVVAVFYGADNAPLGLAFTILDNDLAAGDKTGFEINSMSMPSDITAADVANTTVYAYPMQYQFG